MASFALFERQWTTYRTVVSHDLMEHRALAEATAACLDSWLAQLPSSAAGPAMVDLGCGDLAQLAPLLRRLPLASYTGVDLAAAVLPLAQAALGAVAYPCTWLEGDLLNWIQKPGAPIDILHSAFAVHHLNDEAKATFLQAARRRIAADGLMLLADVFRKPGEALGPYLERYCQRMRGWEALGPEQQVQVIEHVSQFDQPADREAIAAAARDAGWHFHWAWQGNHQAEALAVLTPA